jgi:hypothetical protein
VFDEREGLDRGGDVAAIMLKRAITNKKNRGWRGGGGAVGSNAKEAYRDEMGTGTRTGRGGEGMEGEVAIKKKAEGK